MYIMIILNCILFKGNLNIMNVVGKYLMYLRRIPLVPSGITIHGLTIQKHEFSTKNLQLFLYSSSNFFLNYLLVVYIIYFVY